MTPALPGREEQARRDALTLDYILGLRAAWGDCKAKVAGVAAWAKTLGGIGPALAGNADRANETARHGFAPDPSSP